MSCKTRIIQLADQILQETTKVGNHINSNNIPEPSFGVDGPTNLNLASKGAKTARMTTIGASMQLQDLLHGPIACLRPAVSHRQADILVSSQSSCIKPPMRKFQINASGPEAEYCYNIPSKVPMDGSEISFHDLAQNCNVYEPNIRRIIRYCTLYHRVFQKPHIGSVTHSAESMLLVSDPAIFDTLGMMLNESWQAFARLSFHLVVSIRCLTL